MSQVDFRRLDLPVKVVEPMVTDLTARGGILSSEILRQCSTRAIWTAASPEVTVDELTDLSRGGLRRPARLNPFIRAFIRQFLDGERQRLTIFEDAVARAGDPALESAAQPYVVVDDTVLPYLAGNEHSDSTVRALLMEAWSWRLVGLLTESAETLGDPRTEADLAQLVHDAKHVVVGAWDGEGILVVDR